MTGLTEGAGRIDKRLSLYKLEVFCHVVERGGVTAAAEYLMLAQPAVSAHLRSVREQVGASLMYRDGRELKLTDSGAALYEWAKMVLGSAHELAREIQNLESGTGGTAVIASSMSVGSYVLPTILTSLLEVRPDARLSLHISDPGAAQDMLRRGDCDIAVFVADTPPDRDLVHVEAAGTARFALVTPPDSDLPDELEPRSVEQLPFVCSPPGFSRRRLVDGLFREAGVGGRQVRIELTHPEAMKQAVLNGVGVALLLRASVERELGDHRLREIRVGPHDLAAPVYIATRRDKRLSPFVQSLRREMAEHLRAVLPPRVSDADGT